MKWMYFFPLTFFSGIEGFGLFAVYLLLVMSLALVIHKVRKSAVALSDPELMEVSATV